jgi:hypothetical protein
MEGRGERRKIKHPGKYKQVHRVRGKARNKEGNEKRIRRKRRKFNRKR